MKPTWDRIEVWLAANAPPVLHSLAPPATEEQLLAAEADLGRTLPEDVVLSYLIHDGQHEGWGISERFVYGDQLYPLAKMRSVWNNLADLATDPERVRVRPVGPVRPVRDSPSRVPVAGDDSTHSYFLDFDPAPGGQVGQIVLSFHDDPRITCVAPSFRAWLEGFLNLLETGKYVFCKRRNGLVPVEWTNG